MSSDLVVVVAPPDGGLQAVVTHLVDWAAAGVVGGFAVTTVTVATAVSPVGMVAPHSWWVDASGSVPVRLSGLVADRNPDRIRVIMLSSPLNAVPSTEPAAGLQVVTDLRNTTTAALVQLNVILSRGVPERTPLAIEGWHNVLVSPEQGRSADSAREDLPVYSGPDDLARYATPTVAVLAGLLVGLPDSPLDSLAPPPGQHVRTARSYITTLDAGAVEDRLRDFVMSIDQELPLPATPTGRAVRIEGVQTDTGQMAEALWSRHRPKLHRQRQVAQAAPSTRVSLRRAIAMMFTFLWAALRGAPREWWSRTVAVGKARVAAAVTSVVFGEASAYQAVIKGMAEDLPTSWQVQMPQLREMERVLAEGGDHEAHVSLTELWEELAEASFTLCDGQERNPQLPPVRMGEDVAVLQHAGDCVASAAAGFDLPAGAMSARIGPVHLTSTDYLGARTLWAQLHAVAADADLGPDASREARSLQQWISDRQRSFGFQLATRIGDDYLRCIGEIQGYVATLAQADGGDEMPPSQRSLGRQLLAVLGVALVVVVGLVVLGFMGVVGWLVVAVVGVVAVLGGFGGSIGLFMSHQRALFQLLHHRQEALSQAQTAQANLRDAVVDARRLGDCYQLYLIWARILGAFLSDPMASASEEHAAHRTVSGTVPLSMRFGAAVADPMRIARVGHELRRTAFAPGWLTSAWDACLRAEIDLLGPKGVSLGGDPSELRRLRATQDTLLRGVADTLERDGVPTGGSGSMWARLVHQVTTDPTLAGQLVDTVEVAGAVVPHPDFCPAGTDGVSLATSQAHLAGSPFTARGLNLDAHRADVAWERTASRGLGRISVLVQLSAGAAPSDFASVDSVPLPIPPSPPDWDDPDLSF